MTQVALRGCRISLEIFKGFSAWAWAPCSCGPAGAGAWVAPAGPRAHFQFQQFSPFKLRFLTVLCKFKSKLPFSGYLLFLL